MLCQFPLCRKVNQLQAYIRPLFSVFPSNFGHHKTVVTTKLWSPQNCDQKLCLVTTQSTEFPVLYSRFSSVICFVHSSVCKSVPISRPISLPSYLGIQTFVPTIQYYLAIKRNKIGYRCGWTQKLSYRVKSEREKQTPYINPYMGNLKNYWYRQCHLQNINRDNWPLKVKICVQT